MLEIVLYVLLGLAALALFFLSYQGTRQVNGYSGSTSLALPPIPTALR